MARSIDGCSCSIDMSKPSIYLALSVCKDGKQPSSLGRGIHRQGERERRSR